MPQSLSAVHVHLIFSTKGRRPYLRDRGIRAELHRYLGGISHQLDCPPTMIGGVEDHVHILARLGRTISQADWVKEIKRNSNQWLKRHGPAYDDFEWQAGYAAFSVSASNVDKARRYIAEQEQHHQSMSFQDELRDLLARHGVEWDERYVWD